MVSMILRLNVWIKLLYQVRLIGYQTNLFYNSVLTRLRCKKVTVIGSYIFDQ